MLSAPLTSTLWYRVAGLRLALRADVLARRQLSRGQVWYALRDPRSGRTFRINDGAWALVGRLDGQHALQQVWDEVRLELDEQAPTQDEAITVIAQLAESGLLTGDTTPDLGAAWQRQERRERRGRLMAANPLAFRVPLADPDALLERLAPLAQGLLRTPMLLLWLAVVLAGALTAAAHGPEIYATAARQMLTPRYLALLWVAYPVVKLLHELGHGLAVKRWGGEVHEAGVTVFLLMPLPWVDASAANAFRGRGQRAAVSAAGIAVELFIAAVAALLWPLMQPGLTQDLMLVLMVLGGASSLLVNGNPLMRFDGYYLLSDLMDLPNLALRARACWANWAQRRLLGIAAGPGPAADRRELAWLMGWGAASQAYRWVLWSAILLWLSDWSLAAAVIGAAWMLWSLAVMPAWRMLRFLLTSPALGRRRGRALAVSGVVAVLMLVVLFAVPLPRSTVTQGVVWLPEHASLRAATDGFIYNLYARDGRPVKQGDLLMELVNPELDADAARLEAEVERLNVQHLDALGRDPALAARMAGQLGVARARLADIQQRRGQLRIHSPMDGIFALPREADAVDRHVPKGTAVAHVLPAAAAVGSHARRETGSLPPEGAHPGLGRPGAGMVVRLAVAEADAELVRRGTRSVEVRLEERPGESFAAHLLREVPAAQNTLPSAALGDRAGGLFLTDPADGDGMATLEPVFLADLEVPDLQHPRVGGRVWVRLRHHAEPLAARLAWRLEQLFLGRLAADSRAPKETK
ncbi:MAG: hypothetical protein HY778_17015 [Betaproteobacteria bacterium]|nr:hypothetical protein [Betaproteobacteria bacterium]